MIKSEIYLLLEKNMERGEKKQKKYMKILELIKFGKPSKNRTNFCMVLKQILLVKKLQAEYPLEKQGMLLSGKALQHQQQMLVFAIRSKNFRKNLKKAWHEGEGGGGVKLN